METTVSTPKTLLHRSIAGNAAFSIASGLGLALFAMPLGDLAELPTWLLVVVGVGVALFGVSLAAPLRTGPATRELGAFAAAADVGWVVGAVILLAVPTAMSSSGRWLLAALTLVVAGFAVAELVGLRRMAAQRQ